MYLMRIEIPVEKVPTINDHRKLLRWSLNQLSFVTHRSSTLSMNEIYALSILDHNCHLKTHWITDVVYNVSKKLIIDM